MLQIRRSRRLSVCIETKYSQQCSSSSHLLTFDMVAEIEFDIKKEGKKFYVTSSHFWMTTDRNIDGYFEIQFDKQQQKEFGKLVDTRLAATIAKKNACFKVVDTPKIPITSLPIPTTNQFSVSRRLRHTLRMALSMSIKILESLCV